MGKELAERNGKSLAPAVTRAADILEVLADSPGDFMGPSELARRLDLAKSSVANICNALTSAGLLRRSNGSFGLGRKLAELGAAYLSSFDQVTEFHEACRALGAGFEETVQFAVIGEGLNVIYLARREGAYPVRFASDVGRQLPATCTATGKAMLASLSRRDLAARLHGVEELPRPTARCIGTVQQLHVELDKVRERGYAVDDEETLEGLFCLGVAVDSPGGLASISFSMLKARATYDRLERLIKELQRVADAFASSDGDHHVSR